MSSDSLCVCEHKDSDHREGLGCGCCCCKEFRISIAPLKYLKPDFRISKFFDSFSVKSKWIRKSEVDDYLAELEAKFVALVDAWVQRCGKNLCNFPNAPCPICGYDGRGYFQSSKHDCIQVFLEIIDRDE